MQTFLYKCVVNIMIYKGKMPSSSTLQLLRGTAISVLNLED